MLIRMEKEIITPKGISEIRTGLNRYKRMLSSDCFNYLNALANLEVSALDDSLSEEDRILLSQLKEYRDLVIYNIYYKTKMLLENEKEGNIIIDNGCCFPSYELRAQAKIDNHSIDIFNFNYELGMNGRSSYNQPNFHQEHGIGNVNLYLSKDNTEARKKEILRLLSQYEIESNKKNPYYNDLEVIGGPASSWNFEHIKNLNDLQKQFKELDERKELSSSDKEMIQLQTYYFELLIKKLGINRNKFVEEEHNVTINYSSYENNGMRKNLVIKHPGLNVNAHINNL